MRTSDSIRFGVDRQLVCYGKDGDKTALEIASRLPLSHSNGDGNGELSRKDCGGVRRDVGNITERRLRRQFAPYRLETFYLDGYAVRIFPRPIAF